MLGLAPSHVRGAERISHSVDRSTSTVYKSSDNALNLGANLEMATLEQCSRLKRNRKAL